MPFDSQPAPAGEGIAGRFSHKYGPLPLWAWMAVGLGAALAWSAWRSKKAATQTQPDQSSADAAAGIGGNQYPPVVFQDYDTIITGPWTPPGGGRDHPPCPAPVPTPGPPVGGGPPPGGSKPPVYPKPPASPAGEWVTVSKWTKTGTPWDSTLWGIAKHFGYGAGSNNYTAIWSAPQNAALKARRKEPNKIQQGDRIFVPAK